MGSEAITQPVSQCFPDNSGVKRLLASVLRRKGAPCMEEWGKGLFGPSITEAVLVTQRVVFP